MELSKDKSLLESKSLKNSDVLPVHKEHFNYIVAFMKTVLFMKNQDTSFIFLHFSNNSRKNK
jgi:hypothetical protein